MAKIEAIEKNNLPTMHLHVCSYRVLEWKERVGNFVWIVWACKLSEPIFTLTLSMVGSCVQDNHANDLGGAN